MASGWRNTEKSTCLCLVGVVLHDEVLAGTAWFVVSESYVSGFASYPIHPCRKVDEGCGCW